MRAQVERKWLDRWGPLPVGGLPSVGLTSQKGKQWQQRTCKEKPHEVAAQTDGDHDVARTVTVHIGQGVRCNNTTNAIRDRATSILTLLQPLHACIDTPSRTPRPALATMETIAIATFEHHGAPALQCKHPWIHSYQLYKTQRWAQRVVIGLIVGRHSLDLRLITTSD